MYLQLECHDTPLTAWDISLLGSGDSMRVTNLHARSCFYLAAIPNPTTPFPDADQHAQVSGALRVEDRSDPYESP